MRRKKNYCQLISCVMCALLCCAVSPSHYCTHPSINCDTYHFCFCSHCGVQCNIAACIRRCCFRGCTIHIRLCHVCCALLFLFELFFKLAFFFTAWRIYDCLPHGVFFVWHEKWIIFVSSHVNGGMSAALGIQIQSSIWCCEQAENTHTHEPQSRKPGTRSSQK